jgi:hypothetical protein
MITVREVDLTPLGLRFPNTRVGMVLLQPFLQLSDTEPFKSMDAAKARQLEALERTLAIARACDDGFAERGEDIGFGAFADDDGIFGGLGGFDFAESC